MQVERSTDQRIGDFTDMVTSFRRHLRAENKADQTVMAYTYAPLQLAEFLYLQGMPTKVVNVRREHVEAFLEDLLTRRSAATANNRYRGLVAFFGWLEEEGEVPSSPMVRMKPPAIPQQPVPVPTTKDIQAVLKGCAGNGFEDRRDTAILRLFADSGIRLAELANLQLEGEDGPDLDLDAGLVRVLGKGRRMRTASFGTRTAKALDRYLRARAQHPDRELPWLWLGRRGRMTASGIRQMIWRRSEDAGAPRLHPHSFRHFFSDQFLKAGGQESDLMALNGWSSLEMVRRYAASNRAARARDAHKRFSPGDRL
jgi:site-specific recombinase XerD